MVVARDIGRMTIQKRTNIFLDFIRLYETALDQQFISIYIFTKVLSQKFLFNQAFVNCFESGCPFEDECKQNNEQWRDGCFEKKCRVRTTKDNSKESSIKIVSGGKSAQNRLSYTLFSLSLLFQNTLFVRLITNSILLLWFYLFSRFKINTFCHLFVVFIQNKHYNVFPVIKKKTKKIHTFTFLFASKSRISIKTAFFLALGAQYQHALSLSYFWSKQ